MPLQKQNLTVNIGSLRTDTFEQVLAANGGVLELENCVVNQTGAVSKRNGNVALTSSVAPSGTLPNTWQLATQKGALVSLSKVGANPLEKYSPSLARWTTAPSFLRGAISESRLPWDNGGTNAITSDCAVLGNYIAVAYGAGSTNINEAIVDSQTGKEIYNTTGDFQSARPRVLAINGALVVVYMSLFAGVISFDKWTVASLATSSTPTYSASAAAGLHATNPFMDAMVTAADEITVAFQRSDNTIWAVKYTVSTGAVGARFQLKDATAANIAASQCLGFATQVVATSPVLLVADGAAGVKGHIFGAGLSSNASVSTVIDAAATASVRNVTGWTTGATDYNVLYEVTGASGSLTATNGAKKIGAAITLSAFVLGVGLRSRPFVHPVDSEPYCIFSYDSTKQSSYFLLHLQTAFTNNAPQGRSLTWKATGKSELAGHLSSVVPSGTSAVSALTYRARLQSEGGAGVFFDTGASLIQLSANATTGAPQEASGSLFVPGAALASFDGASYAEESFHIYPEAPTLSAYSSAGGGLVGGQTYSWIAVYRYVDSQGRVRRSSPSDAFQSTVTVGNNTATLNIVSSRILSVSQGAVVVELYRTTAGGTDYFLVTTSANIKTNALTVIVDSVSDASLLSGEALYTTGGVLAYEPPPAMFALAVFDQRLFGVSAEDRSLLWFTAQFVDGQAPKWNEVLTARMNDQNGDITGIKAMDDKLIVFKERAIYVITGSGPDATGVGAYQLPQLIAIGDGVISSQVQSVIGTSDGVYFISAKGICRLTRGLVVEFIGQPMQNYTTSFLCTGAVLMPDVTQIRWYSAAGTTIVYDYVHQVWGIHTAQPTSSVVLYNGMPVMADAAGANRYLETAGTYLERGAQFAQKITLPWLQLAGLRGFERLWRVQGIGSCADAITPIGVTFTYDFDSTTAHQQNVTPGVLWNWEARPARQTATSVKVSIRETAPAGQGFVMAGVTFQCGVKPGLKPVAKVNRAV